MSPCWLVRLRPEGCAEDASVLIQMTFPMPELVSSVSEVDCEVSAAAEVSVRFGAGSALPHATGSLLKDSASQFNDARLAGFKHGT